jgi:peptide/nickel transport system substrate-binding protein
MNTTFTSRLTRRDLICTTVASSGLVLLGGTGSIHQVAAQSATPIPGTAGRQAEPVETGGTLNIGLAGTFSPERQLNAINYGADAAVIGNFFYGRLLTYDLNAVDLYPVLAESWRVSPDGRTLTMSLRPGAAWHDGAPFTTRDVEFSVRTYVHPETAAPYYAVSTFGDLVGASAFRDGEAESISGVRVLDDLTFELEWEQPNGPMFFALSLMLMLPEHILGTMPYQDIATAPLWQQPIGLGPFKFVQTVADQYMEFERFDDYVLGSPHLDRVLVSSYRDSETLLLALQQGEVDWAYAPPGNAYERALQIPTVRPIGGPSLLMQTLVINVDNVPDPRIRQAMMHAIDREALASALFGDQVRISDTFVSPDVAWHNPDVASYPYDPERARALLQEANWEGHSLNFVYYYPDQSTANMAAAVQQYWQAVGIESQPRLITGASVIQEIYEDHTYDVAYWGGPTFAPDPSGLADSLNGANIFPEGYNAPRYQNPQVDALLNEGQSLVDIAERIPIYKEVQAIVMEDLPIIPMWTPDRYIFVNNEFCNISWGTFGGYESAMAFAEIWGRCS